MAYDSILRVLVLRVIRKRTQGGAKSMEHSRPLNQLIVHKLRNIINRSFTLLHSIAIALLIHRRAFYLRHETITSYTIPHLLVFISELLIAFEWLLDQAYRWRLVSRTSLPENLPEDSDDLPGLDVFICTADPEKEPTLEVMSTVLSAMAMDYPAEKLHVYLSDDAGAPVTLRGTQDAWKFARSWIPFCKTYRIKTPCPKAFFSGSADDELEADPAFLRDRKLIQEKYAMMRDSITTGKDEMGSSETSISSSIDHGATVEVIQENYSEREEAEHVKMPRLVYVSREKRPSSPHNFKAGALNVLLRVSGVISDSPYVLVLDCDHYCNDPTSAKQAMCFHLDHDISSSLAFVQFPQRFHNVSDNDIYDSRIRDVFELLWYGMDGLKGPCVSGTNFYMKRKSLYLPSVHEGIDFGEARTSFGQSDEFIKSLHQDYKPIAGGSPTPTNLPQETKRLASCNYEDGTQWGRKVGFLYNSVVEDYFTSFNLHCRGWTSVYINPPRPQFLGTCVTNMNDLLIQITRWSMGLIQVGLSRFCPLIYGPPRMSFLQSMCYARIALFPLLYCLPLWCLATFPQLCLLNGIPLYPPVSSPDFKLFSFVFISAASKHLFEILSTGGSIQIWINETRMWMMKSVTCHAFGSLDAIMTKLKLRKASFVPTNKITDSEQSTRYGKDIFDFEAPGTLLVPMVSLFALNLVSFILGVSRAILQGVSDEMFAQIFISFYVLAINYPVLEGMFFRKDKGRITPFISTISFAAAAAFLIIGSVFLV